MAPPAFSACSFTGRVLISKSGAKYGYACPSSVSMTVRSVSRRDVVRAALCFAVASSISHYLVPNIAFAQGESEALFKVPPLPYSYKALEPVIDSATMKVHHDTLFVGYASKLNAALVRLGRNIPPTDEALMALLAGLKSVKDESIRSALRNQGGGYLNHKQYFASMAPRTNAAPQGKVIDKIVGQFGSMDSFKNEFLSQVTSLFGSGFVYLVKEKNGQLAIRKYANQDHPCMDGNGNVALLGFDCWEHAYFCKYENRRGPFCSAWWDIVNWNEVDRRFISSG